MGQGMNGENLVDFASDVLANPYTLSRRDELISR